MLEQTENEGLSGLEIAIIGMAGEFPGAKNIKEFWNNLKNNVNSISIFTDDFLREVGVKPELLANPRYVKAGAFIENKMKFDAFFFGYSPREAELMVPEMRIFHHSVWSAMEDAGYIPDSYPGKIGLYAGASASSYWEMTTMLTGKSATIGEFASRTFVDKDQLNMRISYNLNLSGPSLAIHAACSTSLVAIHLACQGILSGDCEMALAGGVSLLGGSKPRGYLYQEGIIYSPDGYCRPFDADSNGTVIGEGVGVVVLKALDNAIADNDNIYAVIKGSAVNNDGHAKMGYSTPSGKGQAQVIFDAYNAAQIDPKTISYIEAHGTGTPIGDPIEIEALKSVFGTGKEKFCALGSVKSNIGHLIVAAGVAGIIKAALALKNRIIPATIHFKKPNPKIELENSPFYVLTELTPWNHGPKPLRAGVSSFGIGGSNAHVILEEAPRTTNRSTSLPPISGNNFLLSAKTKSALEKMTMDFQDYLKDNPGINLDDAAYTLKVGRRYLEYREMLTGDTRMSATIMPGNGAKYLVFLFPGDGTQYPGMGKELYLEEPAFANHIKDGFETLKSVMDNDRNNENNDPNGKEFLYPDLLTPPMLFVFQYALAKLMIDWGVKPSAVMGTGIGKYTAACLSGVFSTTEALTHILSKGTPGKEIYGEDQVKLKPFDLDDKLAEQLEQKEVVFITVGPGETLETHVTSHPKKKESHRVISLVKLPGENSPDSHFLRMEMEKLWLYGIDINWNKYYEGRQRNRVSLPTYPFEGEDFYDEKELKHQFENLLAGKTAKTRREDIGDWMYVPVWEQSFAADCQYREPLNNVDWLVFSDDIGIGDQLVEIMPINAGHIIIVKAGIQFQKKSNREFIINPGIDDDYELLFKEIRELEKIPAKILHLWNITPEQKDIDLNQLDKSQDIGLFSILNIARAIGKLNILGNIELDIVTNNTWEVTGDESFLCPGKATIMGAVKVVPLEYPNIKCRHIDIAISSQGKPMGLLISHLKQELQRKNEDILVAIRGDYHWIERLKPMRLEKKEEKNRCLKENGVYVITGGLGGMGLTIAEYLAKTFKAKLILISRKTVPSKETWNDWLNNHPGDDPLCQIIRKLQEIDSYGVEMMVFDADVSDLDRMTTVIRQAEKQLGPINGIFHTAGVIDYAGIIHSRKRQDTANILAPKVKGTLVLDHIFKDSNLDFLILFSSGITYAYHNSFGQIGYIAANDFLNAFTYFKKRHGKTMTISLNWADWRDVGMAIEAYANKLARGRINENRDIKPGERIFNPEGIAPHEGIDALCRIMDYRLPKIAISQFDVDILIEESKAGTFNSSRRIPTQKKKRSYNRDHLTSTYVAPRNDFERKITDIWQDLFGIDNVGIHDNFFEIGGDSLLSITFANRFTELIGETVYGTVVFDAQTIAQLAEYMKERYPSGTAKLLGTQQAILDIEKNDKKTEIDKKIVHQSKEELEKLLNGLDDMSTEQVDALLKEMITQKDGN